MQTSTEPEITDHTDVDVSESEAPSGPAEVVAELERRDLTYEVLGEQAVRVVVPSGDVVMGAVPLLSEASSVAILAERDGVSAVLLRDGADMCVVRRDSGVWEHFRAPGGPSAVVGSWRSGERTRFRQRHGALWQAIPFALDLADRFGVADLMPQETPPPPPVRPEKPTRRTASTSRAPKKVASTKAASTKAAPTPEPLPPICPRCFTQLPSTGKCDCGG